MSVRLYQYAMSRSSFSTSDYQVTVFLASDYQAQNYAEAMGFKSYWKL